MLSPVPTRKRSARAAFTLLEIMIALAILGLLVGLAVNNIGKIFGNSQEDITRLYVKNSLPSSFETYKIAMGSYPSTAEGLQALMTAPANGASKWRGPYVQEDASWPPLDPWNMPYQYKFPGTHNPKRYDLWSMGPDKTDGTADDIGNWDPPATAEETK